MDIRVFLADDHSTIRKALRDLLEAEVNLAVVGEAQNAADLITQSARLLPDVIVLDLSMSPIDPFAVAEEIRHISPSTQIIMISIYLSRAHVIQAMRTGVDGYVLKESAGAELIRAIRTVQEGGVYLSPEAIQLLSGSTVEHTSAPNVKEPHLTMAWP